MNDEYSIVLTTSDSDEETKKIANILLEKKLAACIQVSKIESYYTWENKINVDNENLLSIKSKKEDYLKIEKCIKEVHSYDVPEIVQIPIVNGAESYLSWINDVTI
ncbi:divalent-cation tolerance protein CutA [uncultured Dokdonia sp.]|uniref:divalent-cation tolerance protein CutA n=1 Tax=uncultured Dokdonia sp. TaxID=575653 RepID=UPI0026139508|nr:divalent-cation tolerance protein CutA [uncultured Dokdonia sp.]